MSASPSLKIEDVEPPGCRVCRAIMDVCSKKNLEEHSQHKLGTVAEVMAMPCPHAEWIRAWWESSRPDSSDVPEIWGLVAESGNYERTVCFVFYLEGMTFIRRTCELVLRPDEPGHAGTARNLHPKWIHPSVARSWYSRCLNEHGDRCHKPPWMGLQPGGTTYPRWLVDVRELCVVPFGPATRRYFTLSYTWGQVQCLKANIENIERLKRSGSLHPDQSPTIPRTVYDAIKITQFLGERYLWVDSLCILQDDQAALYRDLNSMHLIYANSIVCLVALAGTNANHGLRGIEGVSAAPRSVEQVTLDMAGGERLSHFKEPCPFRDFKKKDASCPPGTTYIERGWTYQEFAFAPRRLVFTDGPLRWACQDVTWAEEKVHDLHETEFDHLIVMPFTFRMKIRCPSLSTSVGFVAPDFNERHFRFQGDTLRAFLGIQKYLGGILIGGLNYGLPELFFDIALAWTPRIEKSRRMKRRVTRADYASGGDYLPSWSWMSWQANFKFLHDGEFEASWCPEGCVEPVAEWFAAPTPFPPPDQKRPIKCRWYEFKSLANSKGAQVPEGWRELSGDGESPRYYQVAPDEKPEEEEEDNPFSKSRYPIPTPSSTCVSEPIGNLPFLFSKTTRAFLCPRRANPKFHNAIHIDLYSCGGEPAGRLYPHQPEYTERLLSYEKVEIVAVVKGWTVRMHDLTEPRKESQKASGDLSSTRRHTPPSLSTTPWEAKVENEDLRVKMFRARPRSPCYFVLCVTWQHGWATREASGMVLADIWEKIHEPVDLVLG